MSVQVSSLGFAICTPQPIFLFNVFSRCILVVCQERLSAKKDYPAICFKAVRISSFSFQLNISVGNTISDRAFSTCLVEKNVFAKTMICKDHHEGESLIVFPSITV